MCTLRVSPIQTGSSDVSDGIGLFFYNDKETMEHRNMICELAKKNNPVWKLHTGVAKIKKVQNFNYLRNSFTVTYCNNNTVEVHRLRIQDSAASIIFS